MADLDFTVLVLVTLAVSLAVGSFLNVVVHRLPIMLRNNQDSTEHSDPYNLWLPRSHCPHCRARIRLVYLVPVLSWLALKGRCRDCSGTIAVRYPLVELCAPVLAFLAFSQWGWEFSTIPLILCLWMLLVLTVIDIETSLLPDSLTYLLLWMGLIVSVLLPAHATYVSVSSAVLGAATGYLSFRLLYEAFRIITRKESMGFGDFKLAAGVGAWVGIDLLLYVVIFASILGLCVGAILVLMGRYSRSEGIPFAPFLALSAVVGLVYGAEMRAGINALQELVAAGFAV